MEQAPDLSLRSRISFRSSRTYEQGRWVRRRPHEPSPCGRLTDPLQTRLQGKLGVAHLKDCNRVDVDRRREMLQANSSRATARDPFSTLLSDPGPSPATCYPAGSHVIHDDVVPASAPPQAHVEVGGRSGLPSSPPMGVCGGR